jgi:LacI family transcriptional regulator
LNILYHSFEEGITEFSQANEFEFSVQCVRQARTARLGEFTLLDAEDPIQSRMIEPSCVQGMCLTTSVPEHELREIQRRGIFCVELDGYKKSVIPNVYIDRFESTKLAILHLKDLGHKDIGLVLTQFSSTESEQKLLLDLMNFGQEIGINIGGRNSVYCEDWNQDQACEAVKRFLSDKGRKPTALLCGDDFLALGAWDAAIDSGISVPKDLSIVGWGDYLDKSLLTTIKPPLQEMGRKGAEILTGLVQNNNGQENISICLDDCELIVRETTAPAPLR